MNARFYDANTSRFLSQDTFKGNAWEPWTQNLYSYCGNDPINYTDPTGHARKDDERYNNEETIAEKKEREELEYMEANLGEDFDDYMIYYNLAQEKATDLAMAKVKYNIYAAEYAEVDDRISIILHEFEDNYNPAALDTLVALGYTAATLLAGIATVALIETPLVVAMAYVDAELVASTFVAWSDVLPIKPREMRNELWDLRNRRDYLMNEMSRELKIKINAPISIKMANLSMDYYKRQVEKNN